MQEVRFENLIKFKGLTKSHDGKAVTQRNMLFDLRLSIINGGELNETFEVLLKIINEAKEDSDF